MGVIQRLKQTKTQRVAQTHTWHTDLETESAHWVDSVKTTKYCDRYMVSDIRKDICQDPIHFDDQLRLRYPGGLSPWDA